MTERSLQAGLGYIQTAGLEIANSKTARISPGARNQMRSLLSAVEYTEEPYRDDIYIS